MVTEMFIGLGLTLLMMAYLLAIIVGLHDEQGGH